MRIVDPDPGIADSGVWFPVHWDGAPPNVLDVDMNYSYDSLARPSAMTGSASVSNVAYNPADQMTAMTHDGLVETRQYNVLSQLTRITVAGQMDVEYRYSATQNNGQITQMKNWISGEEVNYTYDALGRLSAASTTGPEWGLSFGYDGFGNKVSQTVAKGSGPSMSVRWMGITGWSDIRTMRLASRRRCRGHSLR